MRCGTLDGTPVFTFTAQRLATPNAPAPVYLRTIATGLAEAHALNIAPIVDYLRQAPAVAAAYDEDALSSVVAAGVADAMVAPPRHSSPS